MLLIVLGLLAVAVALSAVRTIRKVGWSDPEDGSLGRQATGVLIAALPCLATTAIIALHLLGMTPTVQLNAGSHSAMDLWSSWVDLWPVLLIGGMGALVAYLVALGVAIKRSSPLAPLLVLCLVHSALQLIVVYGSAPTA